jgi:hypothetical protein
MYPSGFSYVVEVKAVHSEPLLNLLLLDIDFM